MIVIYLGRNTRRNQGLLAFCDKYNIQYTCRDVCLLTAYEVLELFTKTSDCFELLTPSFQRFKHQKQIKLSDLVHLVIEKPYNSFRLPLVVYHKKVYPDISLEEARTFLPRQQKEIMFQDSLLRELMK